LGQTLWGVSNRLAVVRCEMSKVRGISPDRARTITFGEIGGEKKAGGMGHCNETKQGQKGVGLRKRCLVHIEKRKFLVEGGKGREGAKVKEGKRRSGGGLKCDIKNGGTQSLKGWRTKIAVGGQGEEKQTTKRKADVAQGRS